MWRRTLLVWCAISVAGLSAWAGRVPPLTPQQREVLNLASDRTGYDEAALRPLLENAVAWGPGDVAGATLPDYEAIAADPAAYRGEAVLIEGDLLKAEPVEVARPGPWGERLVAWYIRIGEGNTSADLVTVLLPDRAGYLEARRGQGVRVAGRFYKVMRAPRVGGGAVTDYLVFVGGDARVVAVQRGGDFDVGRDWKRAALLGLVVLSAVGFVFWRFRSGLRLNAEPMPLPGQERRRAVQGLRNERVGESDEGDAVEEQGDDEEPLPEDPEAALAELQRRRAAKGD